MDKVLIVDDHPLNIELMEARLKLMGFDVYSATTGKMAIELTQEFKPHIIFLDVMLPDKSGFDVFSTLKDHCFTWDYNPQVVMFSALDDQHVKDKASAMGINVFLTKPITKAQLIKALKDILN